MQIGNKMVAGIASVTVALGGVAGSALIPAKQTPGTDTLRTAGNSGLRMNQLQQIGSHNSYHRELSPAEQAVQKQLNPGSPDLWYSHAPVPQQLEDQRVRTLEFDLFPDPAGGLYTYPLIRKLTGQGRSPTRRWPSPASR